MLCTALGLGTPSPAGGVEACPSQNYLKHNWPLRSLSHKTGSSCATASEGTEDFSGQPEVIQVCQTRLVILVSLQRPAHSRNIIVVLISRCHLQIQGSVACNYYLVSSEVLVGNTKNRFILTYCNVPLLEESLRGVYKYSETGCLQYSRQLLAIHVHNTRWY